MPNVLGKFAGTAGMLETARVVSTGGVAAKLNMPIRTPHEQSAKATTTRKRKKPDLEARFFFMMIFLI